MGSSNFDVDLLTDKLDQFARPNHDPSQDLSPAMAGTFTTANGSPGTMPESIELFNADSTATQNLRTYVTAVLQGILGYRVAVSDISTLYKKTEHVVVAELQKVLTHRDEGLPQTDPRFDDAVKAEE